MIFSKRGRVRGTKSSDWNPQTELVPSRKTVGFKAFAAGTYGLFFCLSKVENPVFNLKSYSTFNLPSCTESAAGTADSAVSTSPFVT